LHSSSAGTARFSRRRPFSLPWFGVYAYWMDKKQPLDESKNRFAEVIRQSKERRDELNNKTRKKQMEDVELPPRDEEIVDTKEEEEPPV
jgi:hypothetical protein